MTDAAPTPFRCHPPFDAAAILRLLQAEFAHMEGRIDPPSSLGALTPGAIEALAQGGEVWVIGVPPVACVFLTPRPGALYLGKLAVAASHRRRGFARALVELAETRARALGLPLLELQTRVELAENHATFRALGFVEAGRTAHPGFDRPTTVTFRRAVP